ncbi:MAG TPA: DUF502 domain-containing protein [Candidatus Obscuribacter sp.]|nr:DUF502 domain-containing protein [Candidatus Obscuribacter sp.]HNA73067.1 DUF502 domain-containing protein [Candidatus Obscuribacter sp.]
MNTSKLSQSRLKNYIVKGALYLVPIALTLVILKVVLGLAYSIVGPFLDAFSGLLLPKNADFMHGLFVGPIQSVLLLLAALTLLGIMASSNFGAKWLKSIDSLFLRIPGVATLHSAGRRVSDLLMLQNNGAALRRVVTVQAVGNLRSIAFVTGETIDTNSGKTFLHVILPFPPNPVMGLPGFIPAEEAIDCDMTVEQGLQYVISLGMAPVPNLKLSQASNQ